MKSIIIFKLLIKMSRERAMRVDREGSVRGGKRRNKINEWMDGRKDEMYTH